VQLTPASARLCAVCGKQKTSEGTYAYTLPLRWLVEAGFALKVQTAYAHAKCLRQAARGEK
jgi:hypothetical protein